MIFESLKYIAYPFDFKNMSFKTNFFQPSNINWAIIFILLMIKMETKGKINWKFLSVIKSQKYIGKRKYHIERQDWINKTSIVSFSLAKEEFLFSLTLKTPKSTLHIISLYNITSRLWITHQGCENQLQTLVIVKQILLVCNIGNVLRTVWRICMLMLWNVLLN